MRRPERLAPGRVGDQRHQRAMRTARGRTRNPVVLAGRVHRIMHEPVRARLHARPAIIGRTIEPHRGAERAARHVERADQAGNQRARPAALVAAPAVVDRLAEGDGDRPERQRHAFDLDGLADTGVRQELVGDAADGGGRHVADLRRPFRRIALHVVDQMREGRTDRDRLVRDGVLIGADLDAVDRERAFERRIDVRRVERHRAPAR